MRIEGNESIFGACFGIRRTYWVVYFHKLSLDQTWRRQKQTKLVKQGAMRPEQWITYCSLAANQQWHPTILFETSLMENHMSCCLLAFGWVNLRVISGVSSPTILPSVVALSLLKLGVLVGEAPAVRLESSDSGNGRNQSMENWRCIDSLFKFKLLWRHMTCFSMFVDIGLILAVSRLVKLLWYSNPDRTAVPSYCRLIIMSCPVTQ